MIIGRGWDQWSHRLTAEFHDYLYNSSARISYLDLDSGPRNDIRRNEVLKKLELVCSTGCVVGLAVSVPTFCRPTPTSVDLDVQRFVPLFEQINRLAQCVEMITTAQPDAPIFIHTRLQITEIEANPLRSVLPCLSVRPPSQFGPPHWQFVDANTELRLRAAQGDGAPASPLSVTFHSCSRQAQRFRFPPTALQQLLAFGVDALGAGGAPPVSVDCTDYALPWRTVQRWFSDAILGFLPSL